jgi:hypothetical protein
MNRPEYTGEAFSLLSFYRFTTRQLHFDERTFSRTEQGTVQGSLGTTSSTSSTSSSSSIKARNRTKDRSITKIIVVSDKSIEVNIVKSQFLYRLERCMHYNPDLAIGRPTAISAPNLGRFVKFLEHPG